MILESILKDNIMEHLECSKLLTDFQHSFRSGRLCVTNLLTFLEDSTKIIDEGGCVDVIYLDFVRLSTKCHTRVLLKVKMHGICIKIRNWIGDWLHDHRQGIVKLNMNDCQS